MAAWPAKFQRSGNHHSPATPRGRSAVPAGNRRPGRFQGTSWQHHQRQLLRHPERSTVRPAAVAVGSDDKPTNSGAIDGTESRHRRHCRARPPRTCSGPQRGLHRHLAPATPRGSGPQSVRRRRTGRAWDFGDDNCQQYPPRERPTSTCDGDGHLGTGGSVPGPQACKAP